MQTGETNDYSVCTTWRADRDDVYLLHVFRGRLEYPELRRKVIALAQEQGCSRVLIEDAGPGMNLLQDLRCSPAQERSVRSAFDPRGQARTYGRPNGED